MNNPGKIPVSITGGGIMTIPQLRKAFDQIQSVAQKIAASQITDASVSKFSEEWKNVFHKKLDDKDAREYLNHIKLLNMGDGSKRTMRTATTRKRGGGQAGGGSNLQGAPLDNVTQQGVYGSYGNFLPYVAGGFGLGIPVDSQTRPALPDPPMTVSRDVGNGAILQNGGGIISRKTTRGRKHHKGNGSRRRKQRGGSNIVTSTNPTSIIQDAKAYMLGQKLPESPSPTDTGNRLALP
jgi:hypothetical protein